jgi:hypothetical protein
MSYNDAANYCVHGTYIGTPCGPDHMCGYCEDGLSVEDVRAMQDDTSHSYVKDDMVTYQGRVWTVELVLPSIPDDLLSIQTCILVDGVTTSRTVAVEASKVEALRA